MENTNSALETSELDERVGVLDDHIMIDLEVLSGIISRKELEDYEEELEEYNEQKEINDNLGLSNKLKKPIEPKYRTGYRLVSVNLSDKIFTSWSQDWDKENDCPVMVIDYYTRDGVDRGQLNIKTTKLGWEYIMTQFGASIHRFQTLNNNA